METSEENVYNILIISTFQQRVDFVLIDQDNEIGARQNKVWRLSGDRDSDYLKRPNKMKSLGFGCPKPLLRHLRLETGIAVIIQS